MRPEETIITYRFGCYEVSNNMNLRGYKSGGRSGDDQANGRIRRDGRANDKRSSWLKVQL